MLEIIRLVKQKVIKATDGQADFFGLLFDRILTLDTQSSSFGKIYYGDGQSYDITNDVFKMTEKGLHIVLFEN